MPTLSGYELHEQLYESVSSIIYRAQRQLDSFPVVLKFLKDEYPVPTELARFKREYEITRHLKINGVIEVYKLLPYENTLVMELEDVGADALVNILKNRRLEFREFLRLAIRITDILGRIHQQGIIHKDINPANIIWNPDTDHLKVIDFGISTTLPREQPEIRSPEVLEGTLAYISPEQTGRMNRSVDYRTDFYSLGATLYHLLTGQPPFQADDALELVYCHLSKMPPPPYELLPHPTPLPDGEGAFLPSPLRRGVGGEVLRTLSAIILKLLAKNAEDRYQSAFGLKADLEWCLEHLHTPDASETPGTAVPFELGQHDRSDKFQVPQKLYGREQEIATLLAAFDRIATPQPEFSHLTSEMLVVAGYSGIGKSALVHEIHKPITSKRGYFIEGKFDQFQRNEPYSALIKAFQSLVCQLLTESEARITWWKEQLLNALGPNGQVMIDVIPEVTLLIGSQPAVPELPPAQAQNRFNFVFQNFVHTFTAPEHPLVIFLDDVQWADLPSLQFLKLLMTGSQIQYVLIIGAYRDNEVNNAHPLMLTLKDIQQAGAAINTITLRPLALHDVTQLIADTLRK